MNRTELLCWLREVDGGRLSELWRAADEARERRVGRAVHLRGLVEISNHCVRGCAYCGISSHVTGLERYRMSRDEIASCAEQAQDLGYGTLVLQAGQDPGLTGDYVASMVSAVKGRTSLAVTLSLGERTPDELRLWRRAGADRYLLRFETSDRDLYDRIHPPLSGERSDRVALLRALSELGYEVGSGVMVGIPGQTYESLARDLELFAELDLDMIGVGPFVPHPSTPMAQDAVRRQAAPEDQVPADDLTTYKVLALARLQCPRANLPATTALRTISPLEGLELALARGANVVMPNLTPWRYRRLYDIYPRPALSDDPGGAHEAFAARIRACGRELGRGRGNARGRVDSGIHRTPASAAAAPCFIDDRALRARLAAPPPSPSRVREVIAKSLSLQALSLDETADLLRADSDELVAEIEEGARELKRRVYGNRIVLFAPLYVGNDCINDCRYCAFRRSNREQIRRTLTEDELCAQVEALEDKGHKRLILVFGEHPRYDAKFIARSTELVYAVKRGHGEIRRVNINAAPLSVDDYRVVKAAGIGTYQIFQETYHRETYEVQHPAGTRKGDYLWRLYGLHRAQEGGCDDVGLGALFGLYDWRYEVLGLVSHALELQRAFGVGPHTISFPRIRPASGVDLDHRWFVDDRDFLRTIAVLRLAVPYTGLILTARETAELRRQAILMGVSQIDAGSRIEIGGYTEAGDAQVVEREQFTLGDVRSLDDVMRELMEQGFVPSFCTACYRLGRTGEHFMEFAIPGFIKRFCTPNALTTLAEYLTDYASPPTRDAGLKLIERELAQLPEGSAKAELLARLDRIRTSDDRDLYV